ncbi:DUF4833 domain-containing protein [Parabacteroides sp. 52]|uniref:DUF4833 domain-containing protein n=1 Tax=unclassified Parabacteroides TaxID=2649774 RepID=UPI0013D675BF|nr:MULTISPECIES: DUF4833 domain-containing protein [unclassified Parabacteroides]MDH6533880.1 hypothetical protein [Parabacteroides sp. PM5-20]NDV54625.1 DUF4833 domain-containing protein [Parabacteroides sp. 52]
MNKKCFFLFFFCLSFSFLYAQENTYPTAERLFHIERSKNKNLVCYDVNIVEGRLESKNPLYIYWVNREEKPGEKKALSMIQKKLAYGYKLLKQGEEHCEITLSAYPDRSMTIQKINQKYVCLIPINGQPAILHSLYVKSKESNSLSVEYVELYGTSLQTQQPVSERVKQ